MVLQIQQASKLHGVAEVPGDKSISHRAALIGAIAEGETVVTNFLPGADCLATLSCLRALGVKVDGPDKTNRVVIYGRGRQGFTEPLGVLDAANSGTTFRLLTGMLAACPFFSVIEGDASLCQRPMGRVIRPLRSMGATILGRAGDNLPPLAIRGGALQGIDYSLPVASAQVKSAILLAALSACTITRITEPGPSRDHTERMLAFFGADIVKNGLTTTLRPGQPLRARNISVPGDISSAAFLMVAATIVPNSQIVIRNVGVNPTRDGIIEVMRRMGARIEVISRRDDYNESRADIYVTNTPLHGVEIAGKLIPRLIDEIPILALAAAVAEGRTIIRDAAELKVKESNRLATVAAELRRFGARIDELEDGLVIDGVKSLTGASASSHGDHRIAMTVLVAGLVAQGVTLLEDSACIDISFPGFTQVLSSLSGV